MSKLKKNQLDIIALIKRSEQDDDGWCEVSLQCLHFLDLLPEELIEHCIFDSKNFVRFTPRGQVIADYL